MAPEPYSTPPKAFISYSWDGDTHKEWVKQLAIRLRKNGVNVTLDRWHAARRPDPGVHGARRPRERLRDRRLHTPIQRAVGRAWRRGWLRRRHHDGLRLHGRRREEVHPGAAARELERGSATWLLGRAKIDLSRDPYSESEYEELLQTLHGAGKKHRQSGPVRTSGTRRGRRQVQLPRW